MEKDQAPSQVSYKVEVTTGTPDGIKKSGGTVISLRSRNDEEALRLAKEYCQKAGVSHARVLYVDPVTGKSVFMDTVRA